MNGTCAHGHTKSVLWSYVPTNMNAYEANMNPYEANMNAYEDNINSL